MDRNLYEVEVVGRVRQGEQTDENSFCWVSRQTLRVVWFRRQGWSVRLICYHLSARKKVYVPGEESLEDRRQIFHGHLYWAIKRKLWSGWREDPEVQIELPIEGEVFSTGLGWASKSHFHRGKEIYHEEEEEEEDTLI